MQKRKVPRDLFLAADDDPIWTWIGIGLVLSVAGVWAIVGWAIDFINWITS